MRGRWLQVLSNFCGGYHGRIEKKAQRMKSKQSKAPRFSRGLRGSIQVVQAHIQVCTAHQSNRPYGVPYAVHYRTLEGVGGALPFTFTQLPRYLPRHYRDMSLSKCSEVTAGKGKKTRAGNIRVGLVTSLAGPRTLFCEIRLCFVFNPQTSEVSRPRMIY